MGKTREVAAVVMVAGLLIGVAARAQAYDAVEVKDGGTISGTVKFAGAPPARKTLEVTKDKEVCGKEKHQSLDLIVGADKGIENAVIRLVDISKGKKWASTQAALDQKGCIYKPHVVVVPAGGDLKILNSDGILHNIHTYSKLNASINKAQPKFKKELTEKFTKPEVIKVTCDAHAWMSGWVIVSDHPYVAVTDEKGAFSLKDVPAGKYKVEIWHETLGKSEKTVTLKPKEETKLNIELAKK